MRFVVRQAESLRDREGAYALRYDVYVTEMGRAQKYADHQRRRLEEPLDSTGHLLVAVDAAGEVVGTARLNLRETIPGDYVNWYGMDAFAPFHPAQSSVTTKLIVAPHLRRSALAVRLARGCYDLAIQEGISFNFIDCNAHLKPFFRGLGFRQVFADFHHPEYGIVSPLVLALRDVHHLHAIRSPFASPSETGEHASVRFFETLLGRTADYVSFGPTHGLEPQPSVG